MKGSAALVQRNDDLSCALKQHTTLLPWRSSDVVSHYCTLSVAHTHHDKLIAISAPPTITDDDALRTCDVISNQYVRLAAAAAAVDSEYGAETIPADGHLRRLAA